MWYILGSRPDEVKPKSLLYINDITDNLGNLARLFADDTSLSYSGRNYDIMKSDINNDLSKLNNEQNCG